MIIWVKDFMWNELLLKQELPDCRKLESKCSVSSSVTYQAADNCFL